MAAATEDAVMTDGARRELAPSVRRVAARASRAACSCAFAAEVPDELDMTGAAPAIHPTRLDYSEFDVPEAVTVITQEDIRRAGYLEISEIFRAVPGFRIVKIGDESRLGYHGTTV